MTQEEAGNLIKYIEDNTWTGNSSPAKYQIDFYSNH